MITYELMLLLRVMPKPELAATLKRTAELIFSKGGIIRKLDNLGTRDMPYRTYNHGVIFTKASYFLLEFNVPPTALQDIRDECGRDIDIIRRRVFKANPEEDFKECTLHEEMLPPPYRKNVQDLIKEAEKHKKRPQFKFNTGLDYSPFQT